VTYKAGGAGIKIIKIAKSTKMFFESGWHKGDFLI